MARVLITGGAGFIGSHLVDACLSRGDEVVVFDNFATGRPSNIAHVKDQICLVQADLRDFEAVRGAMKGVDYIFHEGALGSVPRSIADPITSNDVNIGGTLNVLVAARDAGVKRLVFAGSSSIYGDSPELPKRETMPFGAKSPYGLTKVAGEEYLRLFWETYQFETITLRYFNVFGPRQDPEGAYAAVIPIFVEAILDGRAPRINGTGSVSRDFTYIDNVVQANLKALEAPVSAVGRSYNAGAGGQYSLLQLVDAINRAAGKDIAPEFGPVRAGDIEHSHAAIDAARSALGYDPKVSFEEGIARTVEFHRSIRK